MMSRLCSNVSARKCRAIRGILEGISCPDHQSLVGKRWLSVKELSWCAPKNKRKETGTDATLTKDQKEEKKSGLKRMPEPIERFGIVAAMSRNRVIGLNGTIPWPRCAQDRRILKNLTKDGIMIVGRNTYEEEPNQKHICHAKWCIVVSKTMTDAQLMASNQGAPDTNLKVTQSLPDALGLAKIILEDNNDNNGMASSSRTSHDHVQAPPDSKINCWVCGGESLYEEALRHSSAQEVHLTTIHLDIDVDAARAEPQSNQRLAYAMFPAKHRWDRPFQEESRVEGGPTDDDPDSPQFTCVTYARRRRK